MATAAGRGSMNDPEGRANLDTEPVEPELSQKQGPLEDSSSEAAPASGTGEAPAEGAGDPESTAYEEAVDEIEDPEEAPDGRPTSEQAERDEASRNDRAGRDRYLAWQMDITRGDTLAPGRDLNISYLSSTEKPEFPAISGRLLFRSRDLFVAPPGYEGLLQRTEEVEQRRLILVSGPDHSGKWTCAQNLASELSERLSEPLRIVQYARPRTSELSLSAAVRSESFPNHALVLLRDCFERNVRREELEAAQAQDLREILREKESVLILTGDLERGHLASLDVLSLAAPVEDLHEVFRKNLEYLVKQNEVLLGDQEVVELLNSDLWRDLRPHLATPFHIHQFCSRLSAVVSEARDSRRGFTTLLIRAAQEVAIAGGQAARAWFDNLHPNERFLALLIFLFAGAERRWLEGLERDLIGRLRADDLTWFSDPRKHGLEDARERIHTIEQGGRLEFEEALYERELQRQAENWMHLLWDTLDFVVSLEPRDAWREGWKRQAVGIALGRLGLHDLSRLVATVEEMAGDPGRLRAVVPGYAFQELIRQGEGGAERTVFRVLRAWIRSCDHRQMWSSGAALWRVYLAGRDVDDQEQSRRLKDRTLNLLRLLAMSLTSFELPDRADRGTSEKIRDRAGDVGDRRWRIQSTNFWCVVVAMRQITLADPERAASEIKKWLESGEVSLVKPARRTVRTVYEAFARGGYKPSEKERVPLLRLVPTLLERASERSIDVEVVFLTLRAWLRWFPERIRGELLHFATFGSVTVRERLCSVLSRLWLNPGPVEAKRVARRVLGPKKRGRKGRTANEEGELSRLVAFWCEGTEQEAGRVAQAVAVRCCAADGALPALPAIGAGVAVVDPAVLVPGGGGTGTSAGRAAGAVWRLLALLGSRMDLALLRLGESEPIELVDGSPAGVHDRPRFPRHRLLAPGLERLPPSHRESVFVIGSHLPHDFADLSVLPWLGQLYYLGPARDRKGDEESDGDVHLPLSWPPSAGELESTLAALESDWARRLACAPAECWRELVHVSDVDYLDETSCVARLGALARELDAPPSTGDPHDDPVRRALALALWLAATELLACLQWISSWLPVQQEGPEASRFKGDDWEDAEAQAKRVIAMAAAFALIRLHTAYLPDGPRHGRAPTLLFDGLADPLAQQGDDGVDAVLRLVDHWLADPTWADHFVGDVRDGRGRLERWAARHLEDRPELANRLASCLDSHRDAEGISQSWQALSAAVGRLEAVRKLEQPKALPDLTAGERYVIVVVDSGPGEEGLRSRLTEVALALHRELASCDDEADQGEAVGGPSWVKPVLYRLGERRPFWADADALPSPERLSPRGIRLPRLIGPLLTTLDERREQVDRVILLTGAVPLDLDDWSRSAWWERLTLYGDGSPPSVPNFPTLPVPMTIERAGGGKDEARSEASEIGAFLRRRRTGGTNGNRAAQSSGIDDEMNGA